MKKESFPLMVLKRLLHWPARLPYCVQIDITNVCNLSCTMCPIHYLDIKKTHINFDVFKRIIDNLGGVGEVSLVGLGEPFSHPQVFEAIRYCKAKGLAVKITTNSLLLNNDNIIREVISSGLDAISFSIESLNQEGFDRVAHRDKQVIRNVERLIELKEEMGCLNPRISIQTLIFKNREKDVYEIIKWSAEHKVCRINVLRIHLYFEVRDLERPDREEEKEIFREFAKLRKKYKVRIDCLQDQFFTGLSGFLYKHFKYLLGMDSYCSRLIDFPAISQRGDMIPCCVLPEYKFGNILEQRIEEVWHGERITNFRKNHNQIERCRKCDCWRIKQVT